MTALLAATRSIHLASLMAIFGGSTYALLLRRAGHWEVSPKGTRELFATAAALAIVSGIVWFCLIAGQMSGTSRASLDPATLQTAATATRFGHIFLARFVGLAALGFVCALGVRWHSAVVSILAGLLLASLGPISHAAASRSDIVSVGAITDAAHLLVAGFWLGGLVTLTMFLRQHWDDHASLLEALRLFSIWGTPAVAVLVMSGLFNAISILPVSEMALRNSYFDLLLAKVGLASVMIGLAALNRWHFAPALRNSGEGPMRRLAASVGSEVVLGCAIVLIVGLLGLMSPH